MPAFFIPSPLAAKEVEIEAQPYIAEVADQALEVAQHLVPVDTGELYDSLHVEDAEGGKRVVAGTDHWVFPEFGTSEMPAEPYLRPIIDALGLHR